MKIVTLTTCYNRKNKTIGALSKLTNETPIKGLQIEHVVVDDNSTDGTSEEIRKSFPLVQLLVTKGDYYWASGMRYGWEQAVKSKNFDYLMVYNDDVDFFPGFLESCIDSLVSFNSQEPFTLVGPCCDRGGKVTYGGRKRIFPWHPTANKLVVPVKGNIMEVDLINMNCAFISVGAINHNGFLADYFFHSQADFEYSLRLSQNDGRNYMLDKYVGICELNSMRGTSKDVSLSLWARLARVNGVKERPFSQQVKFYKRYSPCLWPFWVTYPIARIIFSHISKKVMSIKHFFRKGC